MKPLIAAVTALLLTSSGCSKAPALEPSGSTPARVAHTQAVAIPQLAALPDPAPADIAPATAPSPEEVAAFDAPVPK